MPRIGIAASRRLSSPPCSLHFCNEVSRLNTISMYMRASYTVRTCSVSPHSPVQARKPASGLEKPGAFQCTILRAFELPKVYRDVFLLKEVQGYTLAEIAAILGISLETALARWNRACRDFGHLGDSAAKRHAQ
jgi:DNA-directed RNA polymerase specialized sigma24 family protein